MRITKQKITRKPRTARIPTEPEPVRESELWQKHEAVCPYPQLLVPPDDNPRRFKILPGLRCMAIADYLRIQLPSLTRAIYFGRIQSQAVQHFNRAVNMTCEINIPVESVALLDWLSGHPWSVWYREQYTKRYGLKYKKKNRTE